MWYRKVGLLKNQRVIVVLYRYSLHLGVYWFGEGRLDVFVDCVVGLRWYVIRLMPLIELNMR